MTAFHRKWDNPALPQKKIFLLSIWFLYKGPEEGNVLCFLLQEQPPPGAEELKQTGVTVTQTLIQPRCTPCPHTSALPFSLSRSLVLYFN